MKRSSDSFLGIASQCIVARKAAIGMPQHKLRDQYTANLALKINIKLGGVNCIVNKLFPWQKQPYMVFGEPTFAQQDLATQPRSSCQKGCFSACLDPVWSYQYRNQRASNMLCLMQSCQKHRNHPVIRARDILN